MKLVIVESPAKCNSIGKYLGEDYLVMASYGHIRDLSTHGKGGLGVDLNNDFKADYIEDKKKGKQIEDLRKAAKKASEVILATDPDREGEAIAWHLAEVLKLDVATTKRLEFHEITRNAIQEAINNPRTINMDLVNSQECRRVLDRIVGFELTKVLKRKIKTESAGRVQSATLKLIVDHEKEINAFVPEDYWTIDGNITNGNITIDVSLDKVNGESAKLDNEEYAKNVYSRVGDEFFVSDISKVSKKRESKSPFTTSTMQQEAFSKCGFVTSKTAAIAQALYEGKKIGEETVGLITYMRTDSVRLSPQFVESAKEFIVEKYGSNYLGNTNARHKKGQIQDAHEAIRPTSITRTPEFVKPYLTRDEYRLYCLIYNRAIASLMSPNTYELSTIRFNTNDLEFKANSETTLFDGFSILYKDSETEEDEKKYKQQSISNIKVGDIFKRENIELKKHTTEPPAHYTEAKVVKLMEDLGIGRPSTYASTISLITKRAYVKSEKGSLIPQKSGMLSIEYLDQFFGEIIEAGFTADLETKLDDITKANNSRVQILNRFCNFFYPLLDNAIKTEYKIPEEYIESYGICPNCGSYLVKKKGKFGEFIACSNYPTCKYIVKEEKEQPKETGEICPNCGSPMVYRKSRKGDVFEACSNFPKCRYIKQQEKEAPIVIKKCPDCGGDLILRTSARRKQSFLGCTNFPKCKYVEKYVIDKKE